MRLLDVEYCTETETGMMMAQNMIHCTSLNVRTHSHSAVGGGGVTSGSSDTTRPSQVVAMFDDVKHLQ